MPGIKSSPLSLSAAVLAAGDGGGGIAVIAEASQHSAQLAAGLTLTGITAWQSSYLRGGREMKRRRQSENRRNGLIQVPLCC